MLCKIEMAQELVNAVSLLILRSPAHKLRDRFLHNMRHLD